MLSRGTHLEGVWKGTTKTSVSWGLFMLFLDNGDDAYKCWDYLVLKVGVRFVPTSMLSAGSLLDPRGFFDDSRKKIQRPVTFALRCNHP